MANPQQRLEDLGGLHTYTTASKSVVVKLTTHLSCLCSPEDPPLTGCILPSASQYLPNGNPSFPHALGPSWWLDPSSHLPLSSTLRPPSSKLSLPYHCCCARRRNQSLYNRVTWIPPTCAMFLSINLLSCSPIAAEYLIAPVVPSLGLFITSWSNRP